MLKTVSQQIKIERTSICKQCNDYVSSVKTCKKCGCYMPAKTIFAAAECPSGKWTTSEPTDDLIGLVEEAMLKLWNGH